MTIHKPIPRLLDLSIITATAHCKNYRVVMYSDVRLPPNLKTTSFGAYLVILITNSYVFAIEPLYL